MAGFVIGSLVAAGLGWLLLRYAAPRATARSQVLVVMGFAAVLALSLGFVSLGLASESRRLDALAKLEPLTSVESVVAHRMDAQVLVTGRIGAGAQLVLEDYVAYLDFDDLERSRTPDLPVELAGGGEVTVEEPYQPIDWLEATLAYRVVKVGDPVVVVGDAVATTTAPFDESAIDGASLVNAVVFRGTHEAFRQQYLPRTRPFAIFALVWSVICGIAGLVILTVPLPRAWRALRSRAGAG